MSIRHVLFSLVRLFARLGNRPLLFQIRNSEIINAETCLMKICKVFFVPTLFANPFFFAPFAPLIHFLAQEASYNAYKLSYCDGEVEGQLIWPPAPYHWSEDGEHDGEVKLMPLAQMEELRTSCGVKADKDERPANEWFKAVLQELSSVFRQEIGRCDQAARCFCLGVTVVRTCTVNEPASASSLLKPSCSRVQDCVVNSGKSDPCQRV